MSSKLKALAWEECRTGGLIASAATAIGIVLLFQCRWAIGSDAWTRDATFAGFIVLGIPVMTGMLLVLNPDYAGHLVGGFSRRVLRLPVTTAAAVAVALASRAAFVFVTSLILVSLSMRVFDAGPGLEAVYAITLFYLLAQVLDWLRGPLSGLSSLLALFVFAALIERMLPGASNFTPMKWALAASSDSPALWPVALVAAVGLAYAISVAAVTADRVGRRYGVPEIWEWPRRVSFSSSRHRAPFRSALSAQVWFEMRRSAGILPLGTLVLWVVILGAFWIYQAADGKDFDEGVFLIASYVFFVALPFAAGAHGVRTRVMGFRSSSGKAGYELLQPLTSAEFAQARILANLLLLVPTLTIALIVHFALGGRMLVTEWIPEGWRMGATSAREVAWMLLSRGLLVGVAAWALLAIGTRVFRRTLGVTFVFLFVLAFVAWLEDNNFGNFHIEEQKNSVAMTLTVLLVLLPTALTLALFWFARNQDLISARELAGWAGVWALGAWLFHYATIPSWLEEGIALRHQLLATVVALGCASPLPLAYVAVLLDLRRKRHGAARPQDPRQHAHGPMRPVTMVAAACAVVAVIWLGWPAKPAYLEYRKSKGYPATLMDLEASYPEPPPKENFATEYKRLRNERDTLAQAYWNPIKIAAAGKIDALNYDQNLLIAGSAELSRAEPIDKKIWIATEAYWTAVTSKIVPQLGEFVGRDTSKTWYRIDFHNPYRDSIPDAWRSFANEIRLDTLHWAVASKPDQATSGLLAGFALANSMINVPIVYGQSVRMYELFNVSGSIELLLNRSLPSETDLERLQRACERALSDPAALDRAIIGESVVHLRMTSLYPDPDPRVLTRDTLTPFGLAQRLAYPIATQQLMISGELESLLEARRFPWAEFSQRRKRRDSMDFYTQAVFVAPNLWILNSFYDQRLYESLWNARLKLETARVALAVERFRLAHGALPKSLKELVPDFLPEVPEDYYAGAGVPLQFRVRDDGEYVVYSIGRDGRDDLGKETKRSSYEGDLTFTVAPQSVRSGPQVSLEDGSPGTETQKP